MNEAEFLGNDHLDGLFEATVQATEEAIVNAMVAARDMRGEGGRYANAIPTMHWCVAEALRPLPAG